MAEIRINPVCMVATANVSGVGNFSIKVPGTFAGFSSTNNANGRYIRLLNIWAPGGAEGDRLHNLIASDEDGVIPEASRPAFANYPTIAYFDDVSLTETAENLRGVFIPAGESVMIGTLDPNYYVFIPSGLYLKGDFVSAAAVPLGKKCYCNLIWASFS